MKYAPPFLPTSSGDLVSGLATQKLSQLKQDVGISEPTIQELRREKRKRKTWTVLVGCVAGVTVLTALIAMAVEASFICYLAFCFPLLLAPYAVVQRRLIVKAPTIRGQISLCRAHISRLAQQNLQFAKENDSLQNELIRLQDLERRLEQTMKSSGESVEDLRRLIKENATLQQQMTELQRAQELQQLMSAILNSDSNGDNHLTEDEFDMLLSRLRIFNVVGKYRIREALLQSSIGGSVTSLFRTLEQEIEQEGMQPSTSTRNLMAIDPESGMCSDNYHSSFGYARCMD